MRAWASLLLAVVISAAGASHAQVPTYFHAIHCDPQFAAEEDWQALKSLVAAADARGLVLTIQFNPAWSTVVESVPARATQIQSWVAGGHEIGGHHHVLTHPGGWDGYSSEPADSTAAGYLGDMNDWLAALTSMLPSSLEIATVSSLDYDFPAGVDFQTGGSASTPSPFDAASVPTLKTLNGLSVWNLKHAALIAGGVWQTTQMQASFNVTPSDQVFGVAFHPHDYLPGNHANVDIWFDFLVAADPGASRSATAGAILETHRQSLLTPVPAASAGALCIMILLLLGVALPALR